MTAQAFPPSTDDGSQDTTVGIDIANWNTRNSPGFFFMFAGSHLHLAPPLPGYLDRPETKPSDDGQVWPC